MKNYKHEMLKSIFGHLLDFLELHGISRFWPIFLLCAIVFIWVYKDCKKTLLRKMQLGILLYTVLSCLFMAVDQQFFSGKLFEGIHKIVREQPYISSIIVVISASVCITILKFFDKKIGGNAINGCRKNGMYYVADSNKHKKAVSKSIWYSNCLFTLFTVVIIITACISIVLLLFIKFIIPRINISV